MFHRLDLADGKDFFMVEPPRAARSRHHVSHAEVRAYHLELLQTVQRFEGYHLPEADPILFEAYNNLYQKVADRLLPAFKAVDLHPLTRHKFFISAGIVPDPDNPKNMIPDLSELEKMMGFEYFPSSDPNCPPPVTLASGDNEVDLMAGLILIPGLDVRWAMENHSPDYLSRLLKQTIQLQRGEEALKEQQAEADRKLFEKNEKAIVAEFEKLNVPMPF